MTHLLVYAIIEIGFQGGPFMDESCIICFLGLIIYVMPCFFISYVMPYGVCLHMCDPIWYELICF